MTRLRAGFRRAATGFGLVFLAAAALGLVVPPPAIASCAGPQAVLEQDGLPLPPRRVGQGDAEQILYDVDADRPLRVDGSNMTFGCQDTRSTSSGCGGPVADPVPTVEPMRDVGLVLTQRGRSWTFAVADTVRPDLTVQFDVELPAALRPGPARLGLVDRREQSGTELELVVRRSG